MKFVIQRVSHAEVKIDGQVTSKIGDGLLVLIGISQADVELPYEKRKALTDKMIRKTSGMRIFCDENSRTNLALDDVNGSILAVSQFTLYADCKKGNRPSFIEAGAPDDAERIYEYIVSGFRERFGEERIGTGSFGADMKVSLLNDGPFTIVLDSDEIM